MKTYRYMLFLCLGMIFLTGLMSLPVSASEDNKKIKVGYYEEGGFMSQNKEGEYTGFNFAYLKRIAKYTGWEYEVVNGRSFEHTYQMLENGEIDMLPALYYTEERAKNLLFSKMPMCSIYTTLDVRIEDTRYNYEDFDSFNGMRVGVIKNSYDAECFNEYCRANNVTVTIVPYKETKEMLEALDEEAIDGVAVTFMGSNNYRSVAKFSPQPLYFGVAQNEKKLAQALNAAMNQSNLEDPHFDSRLFERYFSNNSDQSPVFTNEEEEYIARAPVIRAVYSSNEEPLEYTDSKTGDFSGTIADMLLLAASYSGLEFKFIPVDTHKDSFQLISEGKADIICSVANDYFWAEQNDINTTDNYLCVPFAEVKKDAVSSVKRIALPEGYNYNREVVENYPMADILYYPTIKECFDAVKKGGADAAYVNTYTANFLLSDPQYESFHMSLVPNFSDDLSIGISKDADPCLSSILDKCVQRISTEQMDTLILSNTITSQPVTMQRIIREYPGEIIGIIALVFAVIIAVLAYILYTNSKYSRHIEKLLYRDSVTGIWNLNKFCIDGEKALENESGFFHALIYMDISQFKTINDSFGFKEGDEVLKVLAGILEQNTAEGEYCARVSADQFVMLVYYEDWEKLSVRTKCISRELNEAMEARGKPYTIQMIFGVYIVKQTDKPDISLFLDFANYARRSGKNARKSKTIRYDEKMRKKELKRRHLSDVMEQALENGEFIPYFQPKYHMESSELVGAEALVRWVGADGNMIPTGDYIPFFEENGFVTEIDWYMYEQVCKYLRKWKDMGLLVHPVSSNFSRLHFEDKNFPAVLAGIADKYNVGHELLEVEITENILMDKLKHVQNHLNELKKLGFLISIDDFGSGYSSLGVLEQLAVDTIKLDRSLIGESSRELRKQIIIEGILTMANQLGIQIICEGIETKEQADMLIHIGCQTAQGFYYAKPMPALDFEKLLQG